jgi:hypothetical protein
VVRSLWPFFVVVRVDETKLVYLEFTPLHSLQGADSENIDKGYS